MGTEKEDDLGQVAPNTQEEVGEKDPLADPQPDRPEESHLLNTYKWHTQDRTPSGEAGKSEAGAPAAPERRRKAPRPSGRRPPHDPSGSSPQEAQGGKGGGALFRKYLRTVSQKFKRPRLQSRNSTPLYQDGGVPGEGEGSEPLAVPQEPPRLSWAPPQEIPIWDISRCDLQDRQILIPRDDEPIMWTRNRASSCLSSVSMQNLTGSHSNLECTPDHVTNTGPRIKSSDGGVRGMIKRRFMGGALRKSNTQMDTVGVTSGGRVHGSRDSLYVPVTAADSLDLGSDKSTIVRPVHSSILGEKYCFEVINTENNHCFGCSSAAERDRWIEDLRRAAHPNKDNCERTESSLSLWVNEAKDLPPKRRYYCELHLDGTLFARTSSRAVGKSASRSGQASDGGSGSSGGLTLHLFRDEDPKKKRHSRDEAYMQPLGSVAIPLAEITGRAYQERWYPIVPYKVPGPGGTRDQLGPQASIRVKARFQNLHVLPIEKYKEFAEFVTVDYMGMCSSLEPLLSVKEKEELAGALVHVLQSIGMAKNFLIDLGSAEVQRCGEKEALIFRENTLATKAIDEYMKLVGQKYLIETLGDFIARLYASSESSEVDPRKCPASELLSNQKHLMETCEEVVKRITEMHSSFPVELNEIFSRWVEESLPRPAHPPTLTLTAKVIQNLANFTSFGEKEEYMLFMNDFLQQHWESMRGFLQRVSSPDSELDMAHFNGYVDLPLRLAVLHSLLTDIIAPMRQDTIDQLHPLPSILNEISASLHPELSLPGLGAGHSKPTFVAPRELEKYSPHHSSLAQLPMDGTGGQAARDAKARKRVMRTQSVPDRIKHQRRPPKRQASNEVLPQEDQASDSHPPIDISYPQNFGNVKNTPTPVPWIINVANKEPYEAKTQHEELNLLDKHEQELSELRSAVEQVTERELEMAKRLEDFIAQSQDQNALLQAEVQDLRDLLADREEQLASATFRLGVIEEEREEDEKKLNVAVAAAERMSQLEEQFAGLLKDIHQMGGQTNTEQAVPETKAEIESS
ncbi:hypothetical protein ANANG_G00030930 [Anguilla anguilla]|uniref:Ras-GAP domain-containing protein n=1 Tax=Anguilla anguilla TaxID=7936 RepID=A0A9D3MRZ3_ANGAN|nr:hypothetical protein ANANG_G00030930 [Anguilla anguilla]